MEPLADTPQDVEIVTSSTVFDGRIWDVRADRVRMNDAEFTREYVAHPGAVAVLAMDDEGRVLLIKQYRHPIRTREWEVPAGLLDVSGEPPLIAAQRELVEEAELQAEHWESLIEFHTSPGGSDELIHLFLARGVTAAESEFVRTEEEASIQTRWVPLDDAVAAVLDGRLQNSILMIAVLAAHARFR